LAPAAGAGAQDATMTFPPAGAGRWQGLVHFAGSVSSDSVADDGSFTTQITDVIDDTGIAIDFTVDDAGKATGQMTVDITWFVEAVGTAPTTFDPFHVTHDQHQTGTLSVSGTAERLVAGGTLTWETNTNAEGGQVEEVSGTRSVDVEWVFQAFESMCSRVSGRLIETSGVSLMSSALIPRATVGDSSEIHSELVSEFLVWPSEVENPDGIKQAVDEVTQVADEVLQREFPDAEHVAQLVEAWEALNAALAALEGCQAELVNFVPQATEGWLTATVQKVLYRALDSIDHYDAADLAGLWTAGLEVGALNGEIAVGFLDGFRAKLDDAIELGDVAEIEAVLAFAARYGFPELYADAKAALEGTAG
jgi:hypothetical protein